MGCNVGIFADFYPRPHMEGDQLKPRSLRIFFQAISTHALTWRATPACQVDIIVLKFLPTPSHGGRPFNSPASSQILHFYPRPHMEGDLAWHN